MKFAVILSLCVLQGVFARQRVSPKIVGGSDAKETEWRWQASLQQFGGGHICGASLISQYYLVTAAHCVGGGVSRLFIVLGMYDLLGEKGDYQEYLLSDITVHPRWSNNANRGFPNDIAILTLLLPADTNSPYITTIDLPRAGQSFLGAECYITGWGRIYGSGPLPENLQVAAIDVLTQSECRQFYGTSIQDYHTCVYDKATQRRGSCNGDSGGPLNCRVGGTWYLAGDTSFGVVDCPPTYPSVYASVPYFREWIDSIINL